MNKLIRNFLSVLIGRISGHALAFAAAVYLARVLHPEGYGVIGFLSSYTSFFMLLAALGIPVYGVRELARINNPDEKARFSGVWIGTNLLFALAAYLLSVGLLYLLRVDPVIKKFGIIWGVRLIFSGASCYWIFQAHEKMGLVGIRDFLKGLLFCGTVILFVKSSDQLLAAAWLSSGSVLMGELFLMAILFSGFLGFVPRLSLYRRKAAGSLKPVVRIGFALLMVQIYYRTDSVILEFMKGEKSVGLYSAMYQLIFVGESIAVLYFASILPRISAFWHTDREKLSSLLSFSMSIFVVLGFLSGIVGVLFSREIIGIIYGASYSSSHRAFAILIWSMVMTYTALTPAYFLLGTKYQKECSHATITAALVNLVLNFPLIIYYGIFGAAVATVVSKITEFAYVYRRANEKVALGWGIDRALKLAVAVIIALCVGILDQRYEMTAVLNLALVCSSYLVAILMLRVISIKELKRSMKAIEI